MFLHTNHLGKLEKIAFINKGTEGTVYLFQDIHKKLFAVKIYMHSLCAKKERRNIKFVKEHKSIIKILDIGKCQNTGKYKNKTYNIFPYYPFGDLRNKTKLLLNRKNIIKSLFTGIDHCHKNDLCHRDIKPGNILIENKNSVVLCDFGLATDKVSVKHRAGTPCYISPEIRLGKLYDYRCDLWSAGMTCLHLYTDNDFIRDMYTAEIDNYEFIKYHHPQTWYKFPDYIKTILENTLVPAKSRINAEEIIMTC